MKSINDIVFESTGKWWVPFVELFQSHVEEILKAGGCQYRTEHNAKVHKRGSDRSTMFGISYTNKQGVRCGYDFQIPDPSPIPSIGCYARGTNNVADDLIKQNIKKLPKLNFDRLGNIIC